MTGVPDSPALLGHNVTYLQNHLIETGLLQSPLAQRAVPLSTLALSLSFSHSLCFSVSLSLSPARFLALPLFLRLSLTFSFALSLALNLSLSRSLSFLSSSVSHTCTQRFTHT